VDDSGRNEWYDGGLGDRVVFFGGDSGGLWLLYWAEVLSFWLFLLVIGVITVFAVCTSVVLTGD